MDYPCVKFSDCSFSRFGSIMQANSHRQTDMNERFTPTTLVGVSNKRQPTRTSVQTCLLDLVFVEITSSTCWRSAWSSLPSNSFNSS